MEYSEMAQEEGSSITLERQNDVITITAPGVGDYILKCRGSTKQIWLCSPISGSEGYDWVVHGKKQYVDDGVTMGQWLHMNSGTNLSEVLNTELGLEMEMYFG
ncbi:Mitochondrial chaperone Frataxin [Trapelia coarctata]|nr:Mitochondrial chaperone Frataxin [Trapelia coarctata]